MKVAVIVTGVLRNFQMPMANWKWPNCWGHIDYFLVTWDEVTHTYVKHEPPKPAYSKIEECTRILPFKEIVVMRADQVSRKAFNNYRQMFLWRRALDIASRNIEYDAYVIIRPDAVMYRTLMANNHEAYLPLLQKNAITAQIVVDLETGEPVGNNITENVIIIGKDAVPTMKLVVDSLQEKYFGEQIDPSWNIHKDMYDALLHFYKATPGIEIKPIRFFEHFVARREGVARTYSYEDLLLEFDYGKWFFIYQMQGRNSTRLLEKPAADASPMV